jgi:NAD(P)-dependent dehydrogenase (short-subunit alcohol dehydrogenase family)
MSAPVAFVTGASRGIGRCGALALARAGFDVVITARTMKEGAGRADGGSGGVVLPGSLETTAAEIELLGRRALPVRMDLLERGSVEHAFRTAMATWERIDVLVNNAIYQGPGPMDLVLDLDLDVADIMMKADYLHQLLLVQLALPQMLERGAGTIIDMISATAYLDPPAPAGKGGWGVGYAAAKAAFARVVPLVHVEFAARGIRAFNVDPGFVVNERMKATGADRVFTDAKFRGVPPEVPGAVIGWLASSEDAFALAGQVVIAQKICKELSLVEGWPPT